LSTNAAWADNLARAISNARVGAIAGESRIVWSAAEKARLHRVTDALAVDMESHIASNVAHAHRIPFAALRVIADPAERSLAEAAQTAVAPDGAIRIAHVLKSLLAAPAQTGAVIRAAVDAQAACRALTRCCRLAGPGFCLPDVCELLLDVS
jgi:nucleoside phosphorylase